MWRKKQTPKLKHFSTNELLTELVQRGAVPLYPANEEDELKINLFKTFWQRMSAKELFEALKSDKRKDQMVPYYW